MSPDFAKTQGSLQDVSFKQPSLSKSSAFLALVCGYFTKLDHGIKRAKSRLLVPWSQGRSPANTALIKKATDRPECGQPIECVHGSGPYILQVKIERGHISLPPTDQEPFLLLSSQDILSNNSYLNGSSFLKGSVFWVHFLLTLCTAFLHPFHSPHSTLRSLAIK